MKNGGAQDVCVVDTSDAREERSHLDQVVYVWLARALTSLVAMRPRGEQQGAKRIGVGGGHALVVIARFPC